ncbi:MAG: heavy metal translocating P-type ATPase [Thermoplasmata archaeon]
MPTDPVCGMYVEGSPDDLALTRDNRTYYFCSSSCRSTFADPAHDLRDLARRIAFGIPATILIVFLQYGLLRFAGAEAVAGALALAVQVYLGRPFYQGAWDAIRTRHGNMDLLIAVGSTAAFLYSAVVLGVPGRLPPAVYFDASSAILTLILVGNYLERRTRALAADTLKRLRSILPATVRRIRDGREEAVALEEIQPGDRLRVRPGERIPVDGMVRAGGSSVDESIVTGESVPIGKAPGDSVVSGAINGDGQLEIEARSVGEDTFVGQIGRIVSEAEASKVPLQRTADRIAAAFVPTVLALALAAALGWTLLGGANPTDGILIFVTVTIIACPCAFGLATPAAIVVGTGRAARDGILFKGHDALEQAARLEVLLTDKTGTLTEGRPSLAEFRAIDGEDPRGLLALAAGLESVSEHPFARAVVAEANRQGVVPAPIEGFRALPGEGVEGFSGSRRVTIGRFGSERFPTPDRPPGGSARSEAILAIEGRPKALLRFQDRLRPSAAAAIAELRAMGIPTVMVTGDHEEVARAIAREAGIDEVHAGIPPAGKVEILRRFQSKGGAVGFLGDGINDVAVLTAADVGIAIGAGTDVAQGAGKIVLLRSDWAEVPLALRIARRTVRKVRQNLVWALGYNAILLPIAAGVLVPWLGFSIYSVLPILGATAMALSSTLVLLNSLSLRWIRLLPRAPTRPADRIGERHVKAV